MFKSLNKMWNLSFPFLKLKLFWLYHIFRKILDAQETTTGITIFMESNKIKNEETKEQGQSLNLVFYFRVQGVEVMDKV